MMKHSKKDLFLVIICLMNVGLLILTGLYFDTMSAPQKITSGLFLVAFYCTNYQCVSHNFIHNNFFKSEKLNFLFSLMNSMAMGLPQTLYYHHHMNHHRFNNDKIDPQTKTTKDISSLYRHGKNSDVEGILSYSFIGFFRIDLIALGKRATKPSEKVLLWAEVISVLVFWALLLTISWRFTLFFYLPVWYLGQVAALMENYFEHYGSTPGNRKTDSVSCYNPLYNFLWFNNGYHQEHHFRPTVHWTKIKSIKEELPAKRKIVSGAHFFNLPFN